MTLHIMVNGEPKAIFVEFAHLTHCNLIEGDPAEGAHIATAWTQCSDKDDFDKWTGIKVAFTRAIAKMDRPVRAEMWRAFWREHDLQIARGVELSYKR